MDLFNGTAVYDSDDSDDIPSILPSWDCQHKKEDGSICGIRYLCKTGCDKHYRSLPEKMCAFCNRHSQTGFCARHVKHIYKKNWLEKHKESGKDLGISDSKVKNNF